MAIKKSDDRSNESDSKYAESKSASKAANITERFDDTTHNDNPYDDAIQYLSKKVDEVVDETNKGTTASGSYAGDIKILKTASGSFSTMSGSLSTRVTTNDAKTGTTSTERTRIAANHSKVSMVIGSRSSEAKAGNTTTITSGQASAITANTRKVGFVTTMPTATEGHTVSVSVTNNRDTYALVFTMVDSTGRSPVTRTATIGLSE